MFKKYFMKKITLIGFAILMTFAGCELFETEENKSLTNTCLVGSWSRRICGGNEEAIFVFRSNKTGFFNDYDCNIGCVRKFDFEWELASSSSITLKYTSSFICQPGSPIPSGGTQSFTCSGNTLSLGNTYTRL